MSNTKIIFLDDESAHTTETPNAWRGAMYIWNFVATTYCGLSSFPPGFTAESKAEQMRVWNYGNNHPGMPEHEAIVLLSTMDHALLEPDQWERLVEAFERFAEEHPNSNIGEQAMVLRTVMESDEADGITGIGWNQNTICPTEWMSYTDEDNLQVYDPAARDSHFWIMAQIDETRRTAVEQGAAGGES